MRQCAFQSVSSKEWTLSCHRADTAPAKRRCNFRDWKSVVDLKINKPVIRFGRESIVEPLTRK
jgi:hypothetical protein